MAAALMLGLWGCGDDSGGDNNTGGAPIERSGTIAADETWSGTNVVADGLEVNAVVTLEPCTTVELGSGALVHIRDGGAIVANGTADCPVTFTSAQSSPAEGDWERLDLWASSSNQSSFTHTIFEYGGGDAKWGMIWLEEGARAALSDVTFQHSEGRAAFFETGAEIEEFTNVTLDNLGQEAFRIGANEVGSLTPMTIGENVPPIEVASSTVADDQTWQPVGVPYLVNELEINAELQIAAGTELLVEPGAVHHVRDGGAIVANGEEGNPVVIKSSKSAPAPGDWARFDIWASSANSNSFAWTEIMHGGSDTTYGAVWVEDGATLGLDDVTFSDNDGCDVYDEGTVNATNADFVSCL